MDDEQTTAGGGARGLGRAALDYDSPGHHVLGHADPAVAVDPHRGLLVHAGAVVADMAIDLDVVLPIQPDGDGMLAARIEHVHAARVALVQPLVELAHGVGPEVERQHRISRRAGDRHHATSVRPQL